MRRVRAGERQPALVKVREPCLESLAGNPLHFTPLLAPVGQAWAINACTVCVRSVGVRLMREATRGKWSRKCTSPGAACVAFHVSWFRDGLVFRWFIGSRRVSLDPSYSSYRSGPSLGGLKLFHWHGVPCLAWPFLKLISDFCDASLFSLAQPRIRGHPHSLPRCQHRLYVNGRQ